MTSTRNSRSAAQQFRPPGQQPHRLLEVLVGPVQIAVEPLVHDPVFFELQIGQLEHVEHVVHVAVKVDHQGGIPVDHYKVAPGIRALHAESLVHLRVGERFRLRLGQQFGHLAAVGRQPGGAVVGAGRIGQAEHGVRLGFGTGHRAVHHVGEALGHLGTQPPRGLLRGRAVVETGRVQGHQLGQSLDLQRHPHEDRHHAHVVDVDQHAHGCPPIVADTSAGSTTSGR